MFRYDFQHPEPDSAVSPSDDESATTQEAHDAHTLAVPSEARQSEATPASLPPLVLRPKLSRLVPPPTVALRSALRPSDRLIPNWGRNTSLTTPPSPQGQASPESPQQSDLVSSQRQRQGTHYPFRASFSFHQPSTLRLDITILPPSQPLTFHTMDLSPQIDTILRPVRPELRRLQATSLPPYNPRMQMKSAAQVLSGRLVPIGRHIVQLVKKDIRVAVLEIDICSYIADNYWPQDLMSVDGVRIMEMYRNAAFLTRLQTERWEAEQSQKARKADAPNGTTNSATGESMEGVEDTKGG